MYAMASQVNRDNNDSLWWAILGLTDQWIHGKLDPDRYGRLSMELGQMVERINPKLDESHRRSKGSIQSEDEYRFVLFRHWSLYESMYHSGYVASKLGIWREKGKKRLANFLAKMG
jgi:cell division control protein 45